MQMKHRSDYLESLISAGGILTAAKGIARRSEQRFGNAEKQIFLRQEFHSFARTEAEDLKVFAAEGYNVSEFRRLEAQANKDFTEKLFKKEERFHVAKTATESWFDFLNSPIETSFYSVPVFFGKRSIGILCVETAVDKNRTSKNF